MSRKNVNAKRALRAFLAASSVLVLITSASPIALAAGQGKSGDHGKKADKSIVNSILNAIQTSPVFNGHGKKFENDGNALEGQTNSLLKKLSKLSSGNPAVAVAVTSYINTVDTATATFQTAIKAAKTTYQSATAPADATRKSVIDAAKVAYQTALASATIDTAKQTAEDAFKAAVKAANDAFDTATASALTVYKVAIATAQQNFNVAVAAANLALKTALAGLLPVPTPSPSPSST